MDFSIIKKTTRRIKDKYNDNKVWIITRTKCSITTSHKKYVEDSIAGK